MVYIHPIFLILVTNKNMLNIAPIKNDIIADIANYILETPK